MNEIECRTLYTRWACQIDASPRTVHSYAQNMLYFFRYMSNNKITNPSRQDILTYREELKQKYKPATVHAYMQAVKAFFRWTEEEGIYPNIAKTIKSPKIGQEPRKDCLTADQARGMLSNIDKSSLKGARDYAIAALMTTTGLRVASVIAADVQDIQYSSGQAVLYYKGKGKEGKTEFVKLSPHVLDAIKEYLAFRGELPAAAPLFASNSHRNAGARLTTRSLSRIVKDRMIEAGLNSPRLTAHSLRHTAATINLLNGATLQETQQLLAHANINTTMIYTHMLDRIKNQSELRISQAIFL